MASVETTKKARAIQLFRAGWSVREIARQLQTSASYVANVLIAGGFAPDYVDLYTHTGPQNDYSETMRGVLRFKDVAAAHEAVTKIDALYHEFEEQKNRAGQHQCQVLALTGKNRAEGIGKIAEARIFADWLRDHLDVADRPEDSVQPRLAMEETHPSTAVTQRAA